MRYSSLILAQAISSLAQSCTNGASVTTICTAECSTDRPGFDYQALQVSDFEACATACSSDARCFTAQYRQDNGFCYLKNAISGAVSDSNVDSVVCRTCADGQLIPNTPCVQECNTDRPGDDIRAVGPLVNEPDPLQRCAQLCNDEPECLNAEYLKPNQFCYLKGRTNAAVSNALVDGIVCRTASPTTTSTVSSCIRHNGQPGVANHHDSRLPLLLKPPQRNPQPLRYAAYLFDRHVFLSIADR